MVKVGIFWAVEGKIYAYAEDRQTAQFSGRENLSQIIDSHFSHFRMWDNELSKKFPRADFATYPRGRVLFDMKGGRHIIHADKCITKAQLNEVTSIFNAIDPIICADEHYRCDVCLKSRLPKLDVSEYSDCYKVILDTGEDLIQRTLTKEYGASTECGFEDIVFCLNPRIYRGQLSCKFLVDEVPSTAFSSFFKEHTDIVPRYVVQDKIYHKILDDKNKIGANLIELACNGKNYLIECGTELEQTESGSKLRKKLLKKHYDACFISHYHGDHAGLLGQPVNCDSIYMGEATFTILKTIDGICNENINKVVTFKSGMQIAINDMIFTPYLCDHSAYDSYMLYFKGNKNSILYSGDFRSHGRKSFSALLKRLPEKVDTLICEGTNIGADKAYISEADVEDKLVEICKGGKPVFVLQSTTNIDRIVSVFRAAKRSNRLFIMRLIQADICCELPNIPQPKDYDECYTYAKYRLSPEEFGETDTGVNDDMNRAYSIVKRFTDMYCAYGFGYWTERNSSQSLIAKKEERIAADMERCYEKAKKILVENRAFLDGIARRLQQKDTLVHSEIKEIRDKTIGAKTLDVEFKNVWQTD